MSKTTKSERKCLITLVTFLKRKDRRLTNCVIDSIFVHIARHYYNGNRHAYH